jgi:hypothetical protein
MGIFPKLLRLCREKGITTRQASLYSMCRDYNNIYEKCLSALKTSEIGETNYALYLLLLLLTGDRPGSQSNNSGLASVNNENITISENDGIFRLQLTGSLKASKFSSKTIFVDKKIATFIQKRKMKLSDNDKLFGDINLTNKNKSKNFFPHFEFQMVRKVAISALFFFQIYCSMAKSKRNICKDKNKYNRLSKK